MKIFSNIKWIAIIGLVTFGLTNCGEEADRSSSNERSEQFCIWGVGNTCRTVSDGCYKLLTPYSVSREFRHLESLTGSSRQERNELMSMTGNPYIEANQYVYLMNRFADFTTAPDKKELFMFYSSSNVIPSNLIGYQMNDNVLSSLEPVADSNCQ